MNKWMPGAGRVVPKDVSSRSSRLPERLRVQLLP